MNKKHVPAPQRACLFWTTTTRKRYGVTPMYKADQVLANIIIKTSQIPSFSVHHRGICCKGAST